MFMVTICLGAAKRHPALDEAVASSERDTADGDRVYFRGEVGTVKNIRYSKGEKILFCFLTFFL